MLCLFYHRYQRDQEDRDREALLTRRFERNDADTSVRIDAALQHNTKLTDANREMDNLLGHGSSILTNLQDQRLTAICKNVTHTRLTLHSLR